MALHVHYNSTYISLPSSANRLRGLTNFLVFSTMTVFTLETDNPSKTGYSSSTDLRTLSKPGRQRQQQRQRH